MTFPFTVRSGDNLSAIARRFGLKSFRDIYDHPDNAAFRIKRPNPNLIFPGDVVMIPDAGPPGPPSTRVLGSDVRYCGNDPKRRAETQASGSTGPSLAFKFTDSGSLVSAPGSGGGPSPKAAALLRVPDALALTASARREVTRVHFFKPNPIFPVPIVGIEAVNTHFHLPNPFPKPGFGGPFQFLSNRGEFLDEIDRAFERIEQNLKNAANIFLDNFDDLTGTAFADPDNTMPAFTIGDVKAGFEAAFATGIHFRPLFTTLGPNKQAEIIVHESSHFLNNKIILDHAHPVKDPLLYAQISPGIALLNAYSYSQFVLHIKFGRETTLKGDGTRDGK
jgi:hypothetical protein